MSDIKRVNIDKLKEVKSNFGNNVANNAAASSKIKIVDNYLNNINEYTNQVGNMFGDTANKARETFDSAIKTVDEKIGGASDTVQNFLDDLQGIPHNEDAAKVVEEIKTNAGGVLDTTGEIVGNTFDNVGKAIGDGIDNISRPFNDIINGINRDENGNYQIEYNKTDSKRIEFFNSNDKLIKRVTRNEAEHFEREELFDENGKIIQLIDKDLDDTNSNTVYTTVENYDSNGKKIETIKTNSEGVSKKTAYTYFDNGKMKESSEEKFEGGQSIKKYNENSELIETDEIDSNGNIEQSKYGSNGRETEVNYIMSNGKEYYEKYDDNGKVLESVKPGEGIESGNIDYIHTINDPNTNNSTSTTYYKDGSSHTMDYVQHEDGSFERIHNYSDGRFSHQVYDINGRIIESTDNYMDYH